MPLLRKEYHDHIYILAISLLVISVPLSRYGMSLAQIILFGNWLLEGNLLQKVRRFLHNKAALAFTSLFVLHLVGLIFTSDFGYAWKDIRTKIPLAMLPLVLATSGPLSAITFRKILHLYLAAVVTGTITGIYILDNQVVTDLRMLSPYISHIRFGLNVCLAIVVVFYFLIKRADHGVTFHRVIYFVLLVWFIVYLYISQSFTGYLILGFLIWIALVFRSITIKDLRIRIASVLIVMIIPVFCMAYLQREYRQFFGSGSTNPEASLPAQTIHGGWYFHDTLSTEVVGGFSLGRYICEDELRKAWTMRSRFAYDSGGTTGLLISDVLIRYLTSRGLPKDAQGLDSLRDEEIRHIEKGVADVEETRGSPLHRRLRKVFWEYQNYLSTGDPSGHSVMMRLEYWKASLGIIKDQWLCGVGTGDMNTAFAQYYDKVNSQLSPEWRRRSHNQFLSITVGFGLFGGLWFLFSIFYPPWQRKKCGDFLFMGFYLIFLLSMLAEDTLESQDGVTFAAFFYSFFLFAGEEKTPTFEES